MRGILSGAGKYRQTDITLLSFTSYSSKSYIISQINHEMKHLSVNIVLASQVVSHD